MKKISRIFLSQFFLAFIFTIIAIIFIPPIFNRYRVVLKDKGLCEKPGGRMFYHDLNNDGYSELCVLHSNSAKRAAVKISDFKGALINQWNFNGESIPLYFNQFLNFCDRDKNGKAEVYSMIFRNDSVLLTWFEPYGKDKSIKSRFISHFNNKLPLKDIGIDSIQFVDLNHHGSPEAIMDINAGYGLQPRQVFAYDFDHDSLISSIAFGTVIHYPQCKDIDKDGNIELLGNSGSPGNYNRNAIKYHDSSSWLIIFDDKLNIKYEPLEFSGFRTQIMPFYFTVNKTDHILVYSINKSINSLPHQLSLFDSRMKLLKKVDIPFNPLDDIRFVQKRTESVDDIMLLVPDGYIYKVMPDLSLKKCIKVPDNKRRTIFSLNCNIDKNDEILFITDDLKQGWIYSSDFKYKTPLPEIYGSTLNLNINIIRYGSKKTAFCIQSGENFFIYSYSLNPLYYFRFLIYIGIYFLILFIIFIIRKQQQLQFQRKIDLKNRLQELQLKAVNNQLDPHFTFNVINRIGSAVLKNHDKEKTYKLITGFSGYLRNALMQSDKIALTISEEIENTIAYLELMKSQEVANFDYKVSITKEVNQNVPIPKTLIFTFAENALKHGIMNQEKKGELLINVLMKNPDLMIEVEDNGLGINLTKGSKNENSTGKGLKIIDQIIDLYNSLHKSRINYTIEEIKDDNSLICGTKVIIKFPEAERYG